MKRTVSSSLVGAMVAASRQKSDARAPRQMVDAWHLPGALTAPVETRCRTSFFLPVFVPRGSESRIRTLLAPTLGGEPFLSRCVWMASWWLHRRHCERQAGRRNHYVGGTSRRAGPGLDGQSPTRGRAARPDANLVDSSHCAGEGRPVWPIRQTEKIRTAGRVRDGPFAAAGARNTRSSLCCTV